MNAKRKGQMKRLLKKALRAVTSKTVYCIYIDRKHNMEYRSTITREYGPSDRRLFHVNSCSSCGLVNVVEC